MEQKPTTGKGASNLSAKERLRENRPPQPINEVLAKYGKEKTIILDESDKNLSLSELMKKYDLSKTTAWRLMGRGYIIKGYHDRKYMPEQEWTEKNIGRIEDLVNKAYNTARLKYSDLLPHLKSERGVGQGVHGEDIIQETIAHIISVVGNDRFKQTMKSGEVARDSDAYLFSVARSEIENQMMQSVAKSKFLEGYFDDPREKFLGK